MPEQLCCQQKFDKNRARARATKISMENEVQDSLVEGAGRGSTCSVCALLSPVRSQRKRRRPDEMPPAVVDGTRIIEASEKEKRYECAR